MVATVIVDVPKCAGKLRDTYYECEWSCYVLCHVGFLGTDRKDDRWCSSVPCPLYAQRYTLHRTMPFLPLWLLQEWRT